MSCNCNTKSNDRRICVVLGMEIMLRVSKSCRVEGKCNVTRKKCNDRRLSVVLGKEIMSRVS